MTWSDILSDRQDTLDDIPSLDEQIRTLANIKIEPESESEDEDWDRDAALGIPPKYKEEKSNNSDSTTWSGIYLVPKDIENWSQCGVDNRDEDQFFSLQSDKSDKDIRKAEIEEICVPEKDENDNTK
jgi:hypothetical protein